MPQWTPAATSHLSRSRASTPCFGLASPHGRAADSFVHSIAKSRFRPPREPMISLSHVCRRTFAEDPEHADASYEQQESDAAPRKHPNSRMRARLFLLAKIEVSFIATDRRHPRSEERRVGKECR